MTLLRHHPVDPLEPRRSILRMLQTERFQVESTNRILKSPLNPFLRHYENVKSNGLIEKTCAIWNKLNGFEKVVVVFSTLYASLIVFELGLRGISYLLKKVNLAPKNSKIRHALKVLSSYSPYAKLTKADVFSSKKSPEENKRKLNRINYKAGYSTPQLLISLISSLVLTTLIVSNKNCRY